VDGANEVLGRYIMKHESSNHRELAKCHHRFRLRHRFLGEVGLLQTKEPEDDDAAYIVSTTAQRLKRHIRNPELQFPSSAAMRFACGPQMAV
jgi:hypothetical protein